MWHTKTAKRVVALYQALGLEVVPEGTVFDTTLLSQATGCDVDEIVKGESSLLTLNTPYSDGWFAGRTCSVEHNKAVVFPKHQGDADFWRGVADGLVLRARGV